MKLLHTSDWHVGKSIRGASRADEHRAVLAEIADVATSEDVDLVVVAGDLFDSASPSPESEEIVYRALLALASSGATVAVIAGNHDNAGGLRAVRPLLELGNVHVVSEPRRPNDGGMLSATARDGSPMRVALLPFVSKRGIVRAADLMDAEAFENAQRYSERMRLLLDAMCTPFTDDSVNVLAAHTFVLGAVQGGGERPAHLVDEYAVAGPSFPPTIGYGALGHLHRAQRVPAGPALHYCGSPLQLDFGEDERPRQVNVVMMAPGVPADVRAVRLAAGRPLRTIRGTVDELAAVRFDDDPWLRIVVRSDRRAGLAEQVRDLFGERAVDVRVDAPTGRATPAAERDHGGRSPQELFADYLRSERVDDERIGVLFGDLLDEALQAPAR